MGVQDRDWYREWWAKKEGHVERSRMRINLGKPPAPPVPSLPRLARRIVPASDWHWSLTVLATVVICLLVWGVVRAVAGLR